MSYFFKFDLKFSLASLYLSVEIKTMNYTHNNTWWWHKNSRRR